MQSSLPQSPPIARKGRARLLLNINGSSYTIRRHRAPGMGRHARAWKLVKQTPERPTYFVVRAEGAVACSCPDSTVRHTRCKHVGALIAVGLVSGKGVAR